jgi:hypothetical protein
MYNHHDKLNIMGTEEILKKNVYDLQEQLVVSHKRIIELQSKVEREICLMEEIDHYLKGVKIYTDDITNLLDKNVI